MRPIRHLTDKFPPVGLPDRPDRCLKVTRITRSDSGRVTTRIGGIHVKLLNRGLALAVDGRRPWPPSPRSACKQQRHAQAEPRCSRSMRDQAEGSVAVTEEAGDRQGRLHPHQAATCCRPKPRPTPRSASAKADAYLDKYAALLRRAQQRADPAPGATRTRCGWTVTYTQAYKGVPVFGVQAQGQPRQAGRPDLRQRLRRTRPVARVDPPATSAGRRRQARGRHRQARPAGLGRRRCGRHLRHARRRAPTSSSTARARSRARPARPCWPRQVEVTNVTKKGGNIRDVRLPRRQQPASRSTATRCIHEALDRELRPSPTTAARPTTPATTCANGCGRRATPFPGTLDQDQQNLLNSSGETYWLYEQHVRSRLLRRRRRHA